MRDVRVKKMELEAEGLRTHGLAFVPAERAYSCMAVFTHGYTSHKASILSWGSRLSQEGIPTLLFDLPGHLLGHFYPVESFEQFVAAAPQLFMRAQEWLRGEIGGELEQLILGGHSLGALMAMKALSSPTFAPYQRLHMGVGLGMAPEEKSHVFASDFFAKAMQIRSQLVHPTLVPEVMFPWIKQQKETLVIRGESFYLLNGQDDVVIGKGAGERLQKRLQELGNQVVSETPKSLPHHYPDKAAPHLFSFLRKHFLAQKG